jgi:hypothetical protein
MVSKNIVKFYYICLKITEDMKNIESYVEYIETKYTDIKSYIDYYEENHSKYQSNYVVFIYIHKVYSSDRAAN